MNSLLSRLKPSSKKKNAIAGSPVRGSEIGQPYLVKHNIHVGYNPETGTIEGLPQPWLDLLSQANISKLEQSTNPKAVIDALKYYAHTVKKKANDKFLTTQADIDADVREMDREWPSKDSIESGDSSRSSAEDILGEGSSSASRSSNSNGSSDKSVDNKSIADPSGPAYANINHSATTATFDQSHSKHALSNDLYKLQLEENNLRLEGKPAPLTLENNGNVTQHKHNHHQQQQEAGCTAGHEPIINTTEPTPPIRRKKSPALVKSMTEDEIMARLRQIVNPNDPKEQFKIIKKIGSGASGTVFTAIDVETERKVAIKTMDLAQQPKKELIITEIMVMRENRHENLVNYLDSYLVGNDLWVIMEYLEGGAMTDVVTETIMSEAQMAAVCRETLKAIAFLHSKVSHRHACFARDVQQQDLTRLISSPPGYHSSRYQK